MNSILVVYEQPENCYHIVEKLKNFGYQVHELRGSLQAIDLLRKQKKFSFMIVDSALRDIEAAALIRQLRLLEISIPIVYLAKDEEDQEAIRAAISAGADDFVSRELSEMRAAILARNLSRYAYLNSELDFRARLKGQHLFHSFVAHSDAMRACLKAANNAVRGRKNVYLRGETGTGREDLARALHKHSNLEQGKFVFLQCLDYLQIRSKEHFNDSDIIILPHSYEDEREFYSDLFALSAGEGEEEPREEGNLAGAANDITDWPSYAERQIKAANHGTLCLLNIEYLTQEQQKTLEQLFVQYGGKKRKNFRIITIASTGSEELISKYKFSYPLMKRLAERIVNLPPLRQRREDLPELAAHILREIALEVGHIHHIHGVSGAVVAALMQQPWRGNLRELKNLLYRAALVSSGPLITLKDFAYISHNYGPENKALNHSQTPFCLAEQSYLDEDGHVKSWLRVEKELIEVALKRYQYRMSEVSRRLDIGRSTLYRKLEEYQTKVKKTTRYDH